MKRLFVLSRRWLILVLSPILLSILVPFLPGVASASDAPVLTGYDISPRSAVAGSTITFSFTFNNPTASIQNIGLGATIQMGSNTFSDVSYDVVVSVPPGISTRMRPFRVPDCAPPGAYDVYWGTYAGEAGYLCQCPTNSQPTAVPDSHAGRFSFCFTTSIRGQDRFCFDTGRQ